MSEPEIFRAESIQIGSCGSPTCKNVHVNLCDAEGMVRAVAVIHCDIVIPIISQILDIAENLAGRDLLSLEPSETTH